MKKDKLGVYNVRFDVILAKSGGFPIPARLWNQLRRAWKNVEWPFDIVVLPDHFFSSLLRQGRPSHLNTLGSGIDEFACFLIRYAVIGNTGDEKIKERCLARVGISKSTEQTIVWTWLVGWALTKCTTKGGWWAVHMIIVFIYILSHMSGQNENKLDSSRVID